jgi:hypothetical protein
MEGQEQGCADMARRRDSGEMVAVSGWGNLGSLADG